MRAIPGNGEVATGRRTSSWRCWGLRSRQADSWASTARGPAARAFPGQEAARYLLRALRLPSGEQAIVTKVKPGLAFTNTTPRYDSEAAAGTGMMINADRLALTNNHVIDDSTKITGTVASTDKACPVVGYDKTGDVALSSCRTHPG
jgi:S1-C subfamily serine protease